MCRLFDRRSKRHRIRVLVAIKLISASALFLHSFIMHDERRFETPYARQHTLPPGCLTCGRGTVVLCPSKRVLYPPCRFGSAVRATGTKGLINKSNESINIQTVPRESERERELDMLENHSVAPTPISPCNGNLLFSTEPCRLYLLLCDAQEIGTS